MENNGEEDGALDEEEGADQACGRRSEDGEAGVTAAWIPSRTKSKASDFPTHMLSYSERLGNQDEDKLETRSWILRDVVSKSKGEVAEPERDVYSVSPVMDTCDPSLSSLSSTSTCSSSLQRIEFPSLSSFGSILSLSPQLPQSVELSAVLTDTRLTLDVYPGGAAVLPLLWGSIPEQLRGLQYLRLGSEEKPGLDSALDVVPLLTALRSLAIRGTYYFMCYSHCFKCLFISCCLLC